MKLFRMNTFRWIGIRVAVVVPPWEESHNCFVYEYVGFGREEKDEDGTRQFLQMIENRSGDDNRLFLSQD